MKKQVSLTIACTRPNPRSPVLAYVPAIKVQYWRQCPTSGQSADSSCDASRYALLRLDVVCWQVRPSQAQGLSFLMVSGIPAYIAAEKDGQMSLLFGIMGVDGEGEFYVRTETARIPLYPIERYPEFRFGYTLRFADHRTFSSYFVLSLPSAPKVIQGSLRHAERSPDARVLTSAPVVCQGEAIETLAFNDSDPPGRWSIDVYAHEVFVRRIRFLVHRPL